MNETETLRSSHEKESSEQNEWPRLPIAAIADWRIGNEKKRQQLIADTGLNRNESAIYP